MTKRKIAHIPCEEVLRNVWDYLDDEIDADRKERIRHHLALCDHCRDHYTFEGALLRSLERLLEGGDEAVAPLRERIERTLIEHGLPRA
jgi:mycothiol system anti-sigma-R factor